MVYLYEDLAIVDRDVNNYMKVQGILGRDFISASDTVTVEDSPATGMYFKLLCGKAKR